MNEEIKKKRINERVYQGKNKWLNKNSFRLSLLCSIILLLAALFLTNQTSAVGEVSYCCERTTEGAWCQNSPPAECDPGYRTSATSCDATTYCRLGTCVNSQEGICLENTPQRVCQDNNGVWIEGKPEDIPQCQLGCCLIGDQAAFVTQTRCNYLSNQYGLEINFRTDIRTEEACIASASPRVKGACVLDDGFSRNCRLLTRLECQQLETTATRNTTVEFHEGFLCSAESLGTICGKTQRTTCVDDKFEVYFVDSCGNLANIYDASKINDQEYWTTIKTKAESCNPDSSNVNSATCGNCDYLSIPGSTCKEYKRGDPQTPTKPQYGDFVCADLSCKYDNDGDGKKEQYQHGETWCANSPGTEKNLPGSEYYRLICYNGEVSIESCASFRQSICVEDVIETSKGDFRAARCRSNLWQDCWAQNNSLDCENIDKRDCVWLEGQSILRDNSGRPFVLNEEGELTPGSGGNYAACVPRYAPGFDFWVSKDERTIKSEVGDAEDICMQASQDCIVKFEKPIGGTYECKENCECVGLKKGDNPVGGIARVAQWVSERNNLCVSLGDCGNSVNYIGVQGYQSSGAAQYYKDVND